MAVEANGSPDALAHGSNTEMRDQPALIREACKWDYSSEHPMYVGQHPQTWMAKADVVLVIVSLAPWSPDIHSIRDDCEVIQLGSNPLYSRFPVRNFRSSISISFPRDRRGDRVTHRDGCVGTRCNARRTPPHRTQFVAAGAPFRRAWLGSPVRHGNQACRP